MQNALDHITIKGFRSIRNVEKLSLKPINVLIGPNGSGKSNFVGVFALLNALRKGRLADYTAKRGGADSILWFGSKETQKIELELSFSNKSNGYHVRMSPTNDDQFYTFDEYCWFWDKKFSQPYSNGLLAAGGEAGISRPLTRIGKHVQSYLDSCRIYHFHDTSDSSPIKKTADVDDNRYFRPDGSNLASFLFFLQAKHEAEYQLIRGMVQRAAPFFDDFQLAPLSLNESKIKLEWRHKSSERYFDASSLSDGTLRFICLAVLLLQPRWFRPSVVLLDEPELGLHPFAISMLASMIKSASAHTQTILATQSPLLLDHFEPEDVLVAEQHEGATTIERLDSKNLEVWLEDYSLGQLWEKNQLGGRPSRG